MRVEGEVATGDVKKLKCCKHQGNGELKCCVSVSANETVWSVLVSLASAATAR